MGLMPIFTNNPATPLKSSKMVKIDPNKNNLVSRQSQNFHASKKIKLLEKQLMVQMIPCVYSKFNLIFLKESSFYYLHLPSLFTWMNTTNASRLKWHLKSPSNKVSISPTFYEQLFRTKDFRAAFLYLHCRFKLFWRKEIGAIAARKMLVKLTQGLLLNSVTSFFSCHRSWNAKATDLPIWQKRNYNISQEQYTRYKIRQNYNTQNIIGQRKKERKTG